MTEIELYIEQFLAYLTHIQNCSKTTIAGYRTTLYYFVRKNDVRLLLDINQDMVERWLMNGRVTLKWLPSTYIGYHKRLNGFYIWLEKKGKIPENFIRKVEKPRLEQRLPHRLSKEQAEKVLDITRRMRYTYTYERARNYAMLSIMLFAGLRKSEVVNLMMSDVDFDKSTIYIIQGKGKKDRLVPMCSRLKAILQEYLNERIRLRKTCERFFTTAQYDIPMGLKCIKVFIAKLRKKAGFHFSAHSLRHSFATLMLEGGCDIFSLSKMLGHNKITTTTIYLACSAQQLMRSIEKHPLN